MPAAVRRSCDPEKVCWVWEAIRTISQQRQMPDMTRITRHVERTRNLTKAQAEALVDLCLKDGLLTTHWTVGARGAKKGLEQKSYRMPTTIDGVLVDKHDWYCIECHLAGEVTCCSGCTRVFHPKCSRIAEITVPTRQKPPEQPKDTTVPAVPEANSEESMSTMNSVLTESVEIEETHHTETPTDVVSESTLEVNGTDNAVEIGTDATTVNKEELPSIENTTSETTAITDPTANTDLTANTDSTANTEIVEPLTKSVDVTETSSINMKNLLDIKGNLKRENEETEVDSKINLLVDSNVAQVIDDDVIITHASIPDVPAVDNSVVKPVDTEEPDNSGLNPEEYCFICRMLNQEERVNSLAETTIEEINHLLGFTYERIKSWLPEDTFSPLGEVQGNNQDQVLRMGLLLRTQTTLADIKARLLVGYYTSLEHFRADVLDVQHSVAVLHGVESEEMKAACFLIEDCVYDLSEIRQCRDCYRHSNEKSDVQWFAKPCIPRHEIVFAKQKGYHYWPAKVLKLTEDGQYDVRFFGAKYLRALIDPRNVKPIDTDIYKLKIKRTATFNKSLEELQTHQQLLTYPIGSFSFQMERTQNKLPGDENIDSENAQNTEQSSMTVPIQTSKRMANKKETRKKNRKLSKGVTKKKVIDKTKTQFMTLMNDKNKSNEVLDTVSKNVQVGTLRQKRGKGKALVSKMNSTSVTADNGRSTRTRKRRTSTQVVNDISIYNFNDDDDNDLDGATTDQTYDSMMSDYITNGSAVPANKKRVEQTLNEDTAAKRGRLTMDNKRTPKTKRDLNLTSQSGRSTRATSRKVKAEPKKYSRRRPGEDISFQSTSRILEVEDSSTEEEVDGGDHQEALQSSQDALISSTQEIMTLSQESSPHSLVLTSPPRLATPPRLRGRMSMYQDVVEKLKLAMNQAPDRTLATQIALETLQSETERWQLKLRTMVDDHNSALSETKKKQWCYNCEQEAIYHCCWNTAYCSTLCQQQHWQAEHKKVCRRKR